MTAPRRRHPRRARGAALLAAMLTVTLVATFAAAALWRQWRAAEVEAAERGRLQSAWVLIGAIDWSRLILREDARANGPGGGADHLAEPWAVPLEEAKLSSFLSAEKNIASDALEGLPDAFLSGRIVDAQSKLNVTNLVENGTPSAPSIAAFAKLFELLGLPGGELAALTSSLQQALPTRATATAAAASGSTGTQTTATTAGNIATTSTSATAAAATGTTGIGLPADGTIGESAGPLMPVRVSQLVWLGVSASTAQALAPYVTVLPTRTALNVNTASAEALYASVPSMDLASARRLVAQRTRGYFRTLEEANAQLPEGGAKFDANGRYSVSTNYFEVQGRLRLDRTWVEEQSLLSRDGIDVRIVWRERGAGATAGSATP